MRKTNLLFLMCAAAAAAVLVYFGCLTPSTVPSEGYRPAVYATAGALLPPVLAIGLALATKEVYSSLFVGIVLGALLYADGNPLLMLNTFLFDKSGGALAKIGSTSNIGILIFLVILGILVALMNRSGGSAAFGRWASRSIKSRMGAQIATVVFGMLVFVDDYFNCLTVGSVMRPVTDSQRVGRAKLAYLIDSTAAPVCIIAPVSSWAAAVTASVPEGSDINGFAMFLTTIPFNLYALGTILMMFVLAAGRFDFGPMAREEASAARSPFAEDGAEAGAPRGRGGIFDLVFPVAALIACCVTGMVYSGGFFDGAGFVQAFADADASKGLVLGSVVTFMLVFVAYIGRGVLTFREFTECIPEGFKAMVAPILILALAWTLSGMTGLLGAKFYVHDVMAQFAGGLRMFLPAIVFITAIFLAFATGTSWGTFAILIPLVCHVIQGPESQALLAVSIAACLSGAVCGDHCSPISDTTIMSSAGAQCDHVLHVSTQLPYALTVAAVSAAGYVFAGWAASFGLGAAMLSLPLTLVLLLAVLLIIRRGRAVS